MDGGYRGGARAVSDDLAKDEARQRTARRALRVSWLALAVSVVSAIAALASAYFTGTTFRGGLAVPTISSQPPAPTPSPQPTSTPQNNLLPGPKFQQRQ